MERRQKILNCIKTKADIFLAFAICGVAMYLFCIYSVSKYSEKSSLIVGDMLELYIPALRSFVRNFRTGQGLGYSWDLFLGMNATAYYTAVVGGSFVNGIYLLFPFIDPEDFVLLVLIIKGGLCGAFFVLFSKRVLNTEGITAVFFSVFYAMCGFQTAINSVNYIWMDMVYLLPLLLTFLVTFIEEKKWIGLLFTYAYLFLCNFYIAYIVGIFSALFFGFYILFIGKHTVRGKERNEKKYQNIWKTMLCKGTVYAGIVVLAAGMVAFALVPTALFLLTKFPPDATTPGKYLVQSNPLYLFDRFAFGISWDPYDVRPYLYCGISTVLLIPLYFANRKIATEEKLLYGLLFTLLLLSGMWMPLYLFWHGFDAPDQWYFRFAFIISFLCVSMACRTVGDLWEEAEKKLVIFGIGEIIVGLGIAVFCNRKQLDSTGSGIILNLIIASGWFVYGLILRKSSENRRKYLLYLGILLALAETVGNGYFARQIFQSKSALEIQSLENQKVLEVLSEDRSFYRVSCENTPMENTDTYWGYKGITDFGTFENYEVRKCLEKLGAYTSPRALSNTGLSPLTQMLLGVKYCVWESGSNTAEDMGAKITTYDRWLNLGFLVDGETEGCVLEGENAFENSNKLASCMAGKELTVFDRADERIQIEQKGIVFWQEDGKMHLLADPEMQEVASIDFLLPNDKEYYMLFEGEQELQIVNSPLIYEYCKPGDSGNLGVHYMKKMDIIDDKSICTVMMQNGVTVPYISFDKLWAYSANEEGITELYQTLKDNQLEIMAYRNGYINAKIDVPTTNKILFTSIPYDKGWTVTSNRGIVETVPLLENAFLGVKFPENGEYELIFSYDAPGAQIGKIISLLSYGVLIMILGVYIFKEHIQRESKKQKGSRENGK